MLTRVCEFCGEAEWYHVVVHHERANATQWLASRMVPTTGIEPAFTPPAFACKEFFSW